MTFQDLGLKEELLSAIAQIGYEAPMPIQQETIPFILTKSEDLVALAQTGTGKTAAFGLPILHAIEASQEVTQGLVLAPTRELCMQIAADLKRYAQYIKGLKVTAVYGGESIITQIKELHRTPQLLVATPGRLIDLVNRKKVKLGNISYLVLDEADEMLNMGFLEDIETILQTMPADRRTMLFSATMPQSVARIAKNYMREFCEITVGERNVGSENVSHLYYVVQAKQRYQALKRIVDINPEIYGIVFCRTRQETKEVAEKLLVDGYSADALHGDLSQAQRDAVMSKFRLRGLQILVATDVAARGLDVHDLTHVINYNLPDDIEVYTHRSGRTGRANNRGISISIVHQREQHRIKALEQSLKKEFTRVPVPNGMDVCKKQLFHLIHKMEHVELTDEIDSFLPEIQKKLQYIDKDDLLKRFVSLEFNRFLSYYKDAPDLNVYEKPKAAKERERSKERSSQTSAKGSRKEKVRLVLNLGAKQNFNINRILAFINDVVCDRSVKIGNIDIAPKTTYFEVYAQQADQVLSAFRKHAPHGVQLKPLKEGKGEVRRTIKRKEQAPAPPVNSEKPWRRRR